MMHIPIILLTAALLSASVAAASAADGKRAANTVVLDETGVQNLRIESVEVEETDFEEIVFSVGRIEAITTKTAAVSSRISGRILELKAAPGDQVKAGQDVARIESRQPGDPPPGIVLQAPISGLVTKVDVRLGDPVEPEKALLEITDLSEVYAIARVPEHHAGRMKPGTVAHIKVAALPGGKFDGELLRFGTSADKQSGTIDAIFRLTNPGGLLRAEMRAEFSIVLSKRAGVMSVPRSALQGDAAHRFVYVEDFELPHAFVKARVVVGQTNDRFVEVLSGLLPGDRVVTHGAYSLAFAGGGSVSLREALNAAHGHDHAADGSELKAQDQVKAAAADGHEGGILRWKIISAVLCLLLIVVAFFKRRGATPDEPAPPDRPTTGEAR